MAILFVDSMTCSLRFAGMHLAAFREVRDGRLARDISGIAAPAARGYGFRGRGVFSVLGRGGPDHRGTPPVGAQAGTCFADWVSAHEWQAPRSSSSTNGCIVLIILKEILKGRLLPRRVVHETIGQDTH